MSPASGCTATSGHSPASGNAASGPMGPLCQCLRWSSFLGLPCSPSRGFCASASPMTRLFTMPCGRPSILAMAQMLTRAASARPSCRRTSCAWSSSSRGTFRAMLTEPSTPTPLCPKSRRRKPRRRRRPGRAPPRSLRPATPPWQIPSRPSPPHWTGLPSSAASSAASLASRPTTWKSPGPARKGCSLSLARWRASPNCSALAAWPRMHPAPSQTLSRSTTSGSRPPALPPSGPLPGPDRYRARAPSLPP
mmetsp:Transcript_13466/g.38236  ORF Transcript_13466/g.38236 Transcript_13466/m.38236 type:complete len:250 (+) Transcript_13466:503-1252(+)